jgi:hypothetical protein
MRNFVWGALCGALVMYLYLIGLEEIYRRVADTWDEVSSPPESARRATP